MAPNILLISISLALIETHWFRYTHNALSDLVIGGISAFYFITGLILVRILTFIFSIGLTKSISEKGGAIILAISYAALIGVRLFPTTFYKKHNFSSAMFFIFLTLSFFIIWFTLSKKKVLRFLGG